MSARPWVPALVIAAAVLATGAAGWNNSATADEPYHTLAAWVYVHDGHADLNPEHPPLAKLVAGAALQPLGLEGPSGAPVERLGDLTAEVNRFLFANSRPAMTILRTARLAMLPFLALLLLVVHRWARHAAGDMAGVLALVAVAGQPLVLGHAFVVHTDVAAAATWAATLYLIERWLGGRRPGWVPAGAMLGLALLSKFSAVYLLPIVSVRVLVHALRRDRARAILGLLGAFAVAGIVVLAGYRLAMRYAGPGEERATIDAYMTLFPGTEAITRRLASIARVEPALAHYALGVAYVREVGERAHLNYFCGEVSTRPFALYFPTALALKTSVPFLALLVLGAVSALRTRTPALLAPWLAGAACLLAVATSPYNIGARHVLPALPLLVLPGAVLAASWRATARGALLVLLAGSAVLPFPHYISHLSLLAGSRARAGLVLNDSNLDWNQDWLRLARRAGAEGWRPMALVQTGGTPPNVYLPGAVDALTARIPPAAGYFAVSSMTRVSGVAYLAALRRTEEARRLDSLLTRLEDQGVLVGEIGRSLRVYLLPPSPGPGPTPAAPPATPR
ncbi:MAG: glycosyltransferase family 39 protein [Chloroflexi bacterium]|nr:glycosyltransferase family 39 protein [Thermoleophilia bacterium]MCU0482900.1 glycosyltransferase family 39 protein [Chloroflexota bacterium]